VACPDARPPAYEAVAGLARADRLSTFLTGYYHRGPMAWGRLSKALAPRVIERLERQRRRRHHPGIPGASVAPTFAFDAALAIERRWGSRYPESRRRLARWRTERFDRVVAKRIRKERPDAALLFSDVGTEHALPTCQALGIPAVLSMVHGDVREERRVLERERRRYPEAFPIYLGNAPLDLEELDWLHERRLNDIARADRILVPSAHIAGELERHGTPRERIRVIPYAADTQRFEPRPKRGASDGCVFLFTGGIAQRKGIVDLLRAWRDIRRPTWTLRLLGEPPRNLGPLNGLLDGVELMGRVPHAEVPEVMAAADVFVFPSLFEGSAVVTYEALSSGLPLITTAEAGSVARHGVEGLLVPSADPEALGRAIETLGRDPDLRASMGFAARLRAEQFDWNRYQHSVIEAIDDLINQTN